MDAEGVSVSSLYRVCCCLNALTNTVAPNCSTTGVSGYDPEMRKDADNFRRRTQETLEKSVDETVESAIEKMPSRKKEALERELTSGVDVDVVRQTVTP